MATSSPARRTRAASGTVQRIEIALHDDALDPAGLEARQDLTSAGLGDVRDVRVVRTFFLGGALDDAMAQVAASEVLADPVQDTFRVGGRLAPRSDAPGTKGLRPRLVTITRKTGVTNPEAESARLALQALGMPVDAVHTARTCFVWTSASPRQVLAVARRALGNDVIEDVVQGRLGAWTFPAGARSRIRRRIVRLRALGGEDLEALSVAMGLSLSRIEMETIRDHYKALRREPTHVELETLAQTWSEHCKHKTLAGAVRMEDEAGERRYTNLLKQTVFEATRRLDKSWCWSVFEDNAGVIDFDGEDGVCMKVETHNHPSAIEPYGGAGTGIGGVIRDILGTGLGARPVANTDVFCFGEPDLPLEDVPRGAMHPLRLLKGVVSGVRDYGNRMGIPTVAGAICFDPRYVGNPVVYAGCVGMIPRRYVEKAARPGDLIVAMGGRTGRDGIHGATFSSVELHAESETVSSGAVQIGDPVTEKKVLDVLLQARDLDLFHAVTDCGAGGFSSAVGEMGEQTGADVDLSAAPLKYPGLDGFEIWISEAQERMVAAVPPRKWARLKRLCEAEDVEAVVLGTFTDDARLRVRHGKTVLADMDMGFLHDGLPRIERQATFTRGGTREPRWKPKRSYGRDLKALLGMPQIGSKAWVIRQYDHEVQAGAVVRPLTGPNHGPSDGAVIAPKLGSKRGLVISGGINPAHGDIDPYAMAVACVDEAIRNAVCCGADLSRVALLDNFTWGNCNNPETLGTIVRAAEGCRDAALRYGAPFISGKDSLNNEFKTDGGERIVVPPTLLISAVSVLPDVRKTCTMDLKAVGNELWIVGDTHDECGGSHWYRWRGILGSHVPVAPEEAPRWLRAIAGCIRKGWVRAAHDASEGGLAVAAAEMAFASNHGLRIDLERVPATTDHPGRLLFSESTTRLLLEVPKAHREAVAERLTRAGAPHARIGTVRKAPVFEVRWKPRGAPRQTLIQERTETLRRIWDRALPVVEEVD